MLIQNNGVMSVYSKSPRNHFFAQISEQVDRLEAAALYGLCYVGERCVVEARSNGRYIDRTGNLRSSIGYAVVKDGVLYKVGGLASNAGEARDLIEKLASENSKGIVLIVVAGMNYACYVEAIGLNVITSAELLADKLVPEMLKKIGFSIR